MAKFYGTVQGARGEASRLGHASSGLRTVAASWEGAIVTRLYVNEHGRDCARVEITGWRGSDTQPLLLFDGPCNGRGSYATDLA